MEHGAWSFISLPKTQLPGGGFASLLGRPRSSRGHRGSRLRGRPAADGSSGSETGLRWGRRAGDGEKRSRQTSVWGEEDASPQESGAHSPGVGGPDGGGVRVLRARCSLGPAALGVCRTPWPCFSARGEAGACQPAAGSPWWWAEQTLLISVLGHLSQLRCQVDGNVLIQGVVSDVCEVVQVVEAVQPLPLFGLPQQSVPVGAEDRGGTEHRCDPLTTEDGAGRPQERTRGGGPAIQPLRGQRHHSKKCLLFHGRCFTHYVLHSVTVPPHPPPGFKQRRKPRVLVPPACPQSQSRGGRR